MEVWTYINKETNELIRYNFRPGCIEFGTQYYFTTLKDCPLWFVENEEEILKSLDSNDHPQYNMFWETPAKDKINIKYFDT